MNFPIVREYQDDLLNNNLDNEKRGEPFLVVPGVWSRVIVPRHSPFFVESLKLYFPNGEPMEKDVHYRMFKLMSGLTALTAQKVGCMIELLDPDITEGSMDYDVVGEFSLFDTTMLNLINNTANDDRPVYWENLRNKPVVFPPKLHMHSVLTDVVAWKDLIDVLNLMVYACQKTGQPLIQIKIEHYFTVYNHYLKVYGDMLKKFLADHKNAYDSHGLTQVQVNLPLVDNFKTAAGSQALENRDDLHLTVSGMKTILDEFGFNTNDYMKDGSLPIATFGNTNFIPPSIDGSFEGLGGQLETAGISLESDGSIVFLENRFDGRVDGLYYSVMQTPNDNDLERALTRSFSAYRYTHQRIEADNARVNRICQGSGDECILVMDTRKGFWYIGLTNGSLDPAKHVLSRINMTPLLADLPANADLKYYTRYINVFLMGNWVYISLAHSPSSVATSTDQSGMGDLRYRSLWKVPKASVAAQLPVTAARQNLTFVDGDGVQRTNVSKWNICTPVNDPNWPQGYPYFTKYYHTFVQRQVPGVDFQTTGFYRSQQTFVCPHPTKAGIWVIKFFGAFWARYVATGVNQAWQSPLELTYEINPDTGMMTLLHKTPNLTLDFTNLPQGVNGQDPANMNHMIFAYDGQGATVLDDGTIISSYTVYQGFPRGVFLYRPKNFKTRFDVVSRRWRDQLGVVEDIGIQFENIISPIKSGVRARSFMLGNGSDFYVSGYGDPGNRQKMYNRASPGKIIQRSDVSNLFHGDVRCRALSNKVTEVRNRPETGGACVTTPAAQLDTYGIDVGENSFCVGIQKKFLDLSGNSPEWPIPSEDDGISLVANYATRIAADGVMEIVPTATINYPASIVNLLKREVENVSAMLASPKVLVSICDPTGRLTDKFGWLPVLVQVSWALPGTTTRCQTLLSITPSYSGGVNKTVTGYTVLDRFHVEWPNYAATLTPTNWPVTIAGAENTTSHGPMRAGYYVNGNEIRGYFDTGLVATAPGDGCSTTAEFYFPNKTTRRWANPGVNPGTYIGITGNSGSGLHRAVAPDLGIVIALPHSEAAGGAATLFRRSDDTGYTAMLGNVYPEVGWVIFFKEPIKVVFNGKSYTLPAGTIDLRDIDTAPANKTFYIYTILKDGVAIYEVAQEKRLESPWQLWVGTVVTNNLQILTIERFNVFTVNGQRISELKRGSSIPASSGLTNAEGQIPWLTAGELLP
ncbi:hypothetical protein D3C81_386930 [compost metagenome]